MARCRPELKAQIVCRMIAPSSQSADRLHRETGILMPRSCIGKKPLRARGVVKPNVPTSIDRCWLTTPFCSVGKADLYFTVALW